ncbi:MAG TPA: class I SAM-dependent methyltransferase [Pyrinomonadaceae bacterium]|jgi:SAM-dependent methyltransferase
MGVIDSTTLDPAVQTSASSPLTDQVADAYYKTTAGRGHRSSGEYYEYAALGLKLKLQQWLPENREAICLDLACGCGEFLYLAEKSGFVNTTGVDLCKEELEQARHHVKATLVQVDVLAYLKEAESASLDFISALNLLEHLSKDALLAVLNECRRVLKPGGALVAMVPNAVSPFGGLTRHWDITHEWAFTPNNFRQLAALVGFDREVEFRECGPRVHGFVSAIRYALWQVLRGLIATWFMIEVGTTKDGIYSMDMLVRLHVPSK